MNESEIAFLLRFLDDVLPLGRPNENDRPDITIWMHVHHRMMLLGLSLRFDDRKLFWYTAVNTERNEKK